MPDIDLSELSTKKRNEAFLRRFNGRFFDGYEAFEHMKKPIKKMVVPSATFRGDLVLGDELKISVKAYSKTMEQKAPSAKKRSKLVDLIQPEERNILGDFGKVDMLRSFRVGGDDQKIEENSGDSEEDYDEEEKYETEETGQEVEKYELIRAFRYGKTLVPFSQEDIEASILRTTKGMLVLGFVNETDVNLHSPYRFPGQIMLAMC